MRINYWYFLLRLITYAAGTYLAMYTWIADLPVWFYGLAAGISVFGHLSFYDLEVKVNLLYEGHWARMKEVEPLKVDLGRAGNSILLGFAYGEPIGLSPGSFGQKEMGHFLFCGPSRCGKGLSILTNLLNWQHSALVIDIKGDLYRATAARRKAMGQRVLVLSPSELGHRYDPFADLATDEAIRSVVNVILDPEADGSNAAFARRASSALFACMKAALLLKQPVLPFVRQMTALGLKGFCEQLASLENPTITTEVVDFLGSKPSDYAWENAGNDKFLQNSWTGMVTKLKNLFSEGILRMTSGSDFKALDLVNQPTTVYLVFRESELEFTGQAFQTVVLAMINTLIRHFDLNADAKTLPLACFFDEAGRLPIPKLPDLVSTVAGRGITACIYVQSLSQLREAYGEAGEKTILDNTHTKVFYRPKDLGTAEYISEQCGQLMVEDDRQSGAKDGSVGHSVGLRPRELVTPDELMRWPITRATILTELAPIPAHRLTPFVIPGAKELLELKPPPLPKSYQAVTVKLPTDLGYATQAVRESHQHSDNPQAPTAEKPKNRTGAPAKGKTLSHHIAE